jgi:hypothetical protein
MRLGSELRGALEALGSSMAMHFLNDIFFSLYISWNEAKKRDEKIQCAGQAL